MYRELSSDGHSLRVPILWYRRSFLSLRGHSGLVRNAYLHRRFQVDHDPSIRHQIVACEKVLIGVDKAVQDLKGKFTARQHCKRGVPPLHDISRAHRKSERDSMMISPPGKSRGARGLGRTHQLHFPPEDVVPQQRGRKPPLLSAHVAMHVQHGLILAHKLPLCQYLVPHETVVPTCVDERRQQGVTAMAMTATMGSLSAQAEQQDQELVDGARGLA